LNPPETINASFKAKNDETTELKTPSITTYEKIYVHLYGAMNLIIFFRRQQSVIRTVMDLELNEKSNKPA